MNRSAYAVNSGAMLHGNLRGASFDTVRVVLSVGWRHYAIIFSFASGTLSTNVCIGVLP